MNREQKAAAIEEVAGQIQESEAVFAVDYRGISVPQAAELRAKLIEAGSRFSVVKNTLTERAVDDVGSETLKEFLEGPTAFTFVAAEGGDVAMAAKALSQFRRAHEVLEFKGGIMSGEPLSIEQIESIARLPALEVLHGQVVGVLASPITGLARGLNQMIAGLAIALGQIQAEGKLGAEEPEAAEEPETPAEEAPGDPVAEGETAEAEAETDEAPSEGEEKEG
jgi:large subunit ribosomal protein L10